MLEYLNPFNTKNLFTEIDMNWNLSHDPIIVKYLHFCCLHMKYNNITTVIFSAFMYNIILAFFSRDIPRWARYPKREQQLQPFLAIMQANLCYPDPPPPSWELRILLEHSFTTHIPLLMATGKFRLERRCQSSLRRCYPCYLSIMSLRRRTFWDDLSRFCKSDVRCVAQLTVSLSEGTQGTD